MEFSNLNLHEKASLAIGVSIGQSLKSQDLSELDTNLLLKGITHVFANKELNFSNRQTEEIACVDTIWHEFYEKYWLYIDASIYSFIPSILLIIFNVSIIRRLFKAAEENLKLKKFLHVI